MQTITLSRQDIYRGTLVLVDHEHPLMNYDDKLIQSTLQACHCAINAIGDEFELTIVNQTELTFDQEQNNLNRPNFNEQRFTKVASSVGLILSYPRQFRYVGIPHALIMTKNNWGLKKYHQWLKNYPILHPYLFVYQQQIYEIFYVPITEKVTKLCLSETRKYHLSGNNIDGCIVTARRLYA